MHLSDPSPSSPVAGAFDLCYQSAFTDFFNPALHVSLLPDAPRPAQAAPLSCETKTLQVRVPLSDPDGAPPPFLAPAQRHVGRDLRRISRCREALFISSDTIGALHVLRKIRARLPNAERVKALTASRPAACEHVSYHSVAAIIGSSQDGSGVYK